MDRHGTKASAGNRPVFVSMGMTILDELRFSHQNTVFDVPGGSGLFGTSAFSPLLLILRVVVER